MTILLVVPIKRTSELNIVKPLKNLISAHYHSSDNHEDYSDAINELNRLRNQTLIKVVDKYGFSLEAISG